MNKKPFVTKEQLDEITAKFPTLIICMMKRYPGQCKSSKRSFRMEQRVQRVLCGESMPEPDTDSDHERIWMRM